MSKRLASIRRGIRYQDLVAAEAVLAMISGEPDPPVCVRLEDRDGGSFDDVVVVYGDRVECRQVKWAQHPGAEPLTIQSIAEAKGNKTPPIRKFADSYRAAASSGKSCLLQLITNRSPDSELRGLLEGSRSTLKRTKSKAKKTLLQSAWLSVTDLTPKEFDSFLGCLAFNVNAPDLTRLEEDIRRQLRLMGCPADAFNALMEAIWQWAEEEKKLEIVRGDVLAVLGVDFETPTNEFHLPTVCIPRADAQRLLHARMDDLHAGYLALLGAPGSGKSTLLNTVERDRPGARDHVHVYNCFTGPLDASLQTRATAENFAKFLCRAVREHSWGHSFPLKVASIEDLLTRASKLLPDDHRLVLIIDGLDYAGKHATDNVQALIATLPPAIPPNILVVVSAQAMEQLPRHLKSLEDNRYLELAPLSEKEVLSLLERHGVFERHPATVWEREEIVSVVQTMTAGLPLHVSYVAKLLVALPPSAEKVRKRLTTMPAIHGHIEEYYGTLLETPESALAQDALGVMAACPFELSPDEVANLLEPRANPREVRDTLVPFGHLFNIVGGRYYFSHDSLRLYARRRITTGNVSAGRQFEFLKTLKDDPRVGDHLLHLLSERAPEDAEIIDCDWLAQQLAFGANPLRLHEGLKRLALAALRRNDLAQMSRWWALQNILSRAELGADLSESTLADVWLAVVRLDLVERYTFACSRYLTTVYPGPDLVDVLEQHGQTNVATRLADRILSQPPPPPDDWGRDDSFTRYVRHAAPRISPAELWEKVQTFEAQLNAQVRPNPHIKEDYTPRIREIVEAAIAACLERESLQRAAEWLAISKDLLTPESHASFVAQLHLALGESSTLAPEVTEVIPAIRSRKLLNQLVLSGGFDDDIRAISNLRKLNYLFSDQFREWYDTHIIGDGIADLIDHVEVLARLNLSGLIDAMLRKASQVRIPVCSVFLSAVIRLTRAIREAPDNWPSALEAFIAEIRRIADIRFSHDDVSAAQGFVASMGTILDSTARAAKAAGEERAFGNALTMQLVPALRAARINYDSGRLSLTDVLQELGICRQTQLELLTQTEEFVAQEVSHKTNAYLYIATRKARAGEVDGAKHTFVTGVRAAFTYGYRKDITLNDYLVSFNILAPLLGTRFRQIAELAAGAVVILDDLTDARMPYDTSSYLIAVVSKHDVDLAASLAAWIWKHTRNLRPTRILAAAEYVGADASALTDALQRRAPSVDLHPPVDDDEEVTETPQRKGLEFVTGSTSFSCDRAALALELEHAIESSNYGEGLYRLAPLIKCLMDSRETVEALAVFDQFTDALRTLFAPYPFPTIA